MIPLSDENKDGMQIVYPESNKLYRAPKGPGLCSTHE